MVGGEERRSARRERCGGSAHVAARTARETRSRAGRRARAGRRLNAALAVVLAFALSPFGSVMAYAADAGAQDAGARVAGDASVIADASTMNGWQQVVNSSTANVGRIWTDKSVFAEDVAFSGSGKVDAVEKGSSTFVTVLSALSSTSNLKTTATSPLDIVLVLDASGSMSEWMGNGSDSTPRIKALQDAANSFIDEIAAQNDSITNEQQQHQVAIVKFAGNKSDEVGNKTYWDGWYTYNYSQTMKTMAPCTSQTKDNFKGQINAIRPAGATRADLGLELAAGQTSGRADAKKVVIFFADGTPTSGDSFEPKVASAAVSKAKTMKGAGASVYSVGIFDGADPNADPASGRTSNENKFMQAVSSNYPDATYTQNRDSYTWSFGTRAQNADFYKSATTAADLKTVFDGISQEIVRDAGYPTEVASGDVEQSGYITFTDKLGDYMRVDDFKAIVFADHRFTNPTKTTNGQVDTYVFEGEAGNVLYPKGNLDSVVITVERSENFRTGDVVEVKIPAGLIPLRHFEIDETHGTGSVTPTYPIRICYGSSLKEGVADALSDPSDEMSAYIAANAADGKVCFLANTWSGGSEGDTTAVFTPSKANGYYYITADTPIYDDAACTQRAAYPLDESGTTYYYQRPYYDVDASGNAVAKTGVVAFTGDTLENLNGYVKRDRTQLAYFAAGTPRMTYIDELHTDKVANETATAASAIDPQWADANVNVRLGNNGKLFVEGSGTLAVTKTVTVPDGFDASAYQGKAFPFELRLPSSYAGKTLTGEVRDAQGDKVGEQTLAFSAIAGADADAAAEDAGADADAGSDADAGLAAAATELGARASFTLSHGQTMYVRGLSAEDAYEVVETTANQGGFTATATGEAGTISAFEVSTAAFTNAYAATGVLDGTENLSGTKHLSGRDWNDTDAFAFLISPKGNAPLPENRVVAVTKTDVAAGGDSASFHFGDIAYEKPGTYEYDISEIDEGEDFDGSIVVNPGVSVSEALYHVVVTVTDNGDGTLSATSTMTKLKDDSGALAGGSDQGSVNAAAFDNVYSVKEAAWNLRGTKAYEDESGANPLVGGMFSFELTGVDNGAGYPPMPANATGNKATASVDASGSFGFEQITFGQEHVGKTYRYELREVKLADANPGMAYDESVWDIEVAVSSQESGDDAITVATPHYAKRGDAAGGNAQVNPTFTNVYAPSAAVVEAFAAGTKALAGRDSLANESFEFALSQVSGPSGGVAVERAAATVSGLKDGVAKSFDFGTATFTKPGTYVFKIRETVPQPAASGVAYDTHESMLTVRVVDDGGVLKAAESAYSDASASGTGAAFTNTYRVGSRAYAGLDVSKTLTGRTMAAGEFSFAIQGVATDTATADEAEALLSDADRSFANDEQKASGVACVMKKLAGIVFDSASIGKTYGYEVSEVVPTDGGLSGVTYDEAVHQVRISVADDGAGGLAVATTVDGHKSATVAFANRYAASGASYDTARAGFNKVLEGRDWADDDAFEFVLTADDGAPLPVDENGNAVTRITVNRENAAHFSFGTITFTSEDMKVGTSVVADKTFGYRISEVAGGAEGITYSANVAHVRVRVVDDGAGALVATPQVEGVTFTNVYREFADNEVPIIVAKEIAGNPTEDFTGRFHFTLRALDGGPLPSTTEAVNSANGLVDFGCIAFSPSVFEFEPVAGEGGQDKAAAGGFAEGADEGGSGAAADGAAGAADTGAPAASGDAAAGGTDAAGKEGQASAADAADAANPSGSAGTSLADAAALLEADAAQASFAALPGASGSANASAGAGATADAPTSANAQEDPAPAAVTDTRIFHYSIAEQPSGIPTIVDDATPVAIFEVAVTRDAQGTISAQVTRVWKGAEMAGEPESRAVEKGSPLHTFVNTFEEPYVPPAPDPDPDPAFAALAAKKVLEGRELQAGEFAFELSEGERVVATAANTADGLVAFPAIKYVSAGEHTYTVREIGGDRKDVVYDAAAFRVVVSVRESGGALACTVSYPDGEPVFTNRYVAPEPDPVPAPDDPAGPPAPDDPAEPVAPASDPVPAADDAPAPASDDRVGVTPVRRTGLLAKTGDGAPFAAALAVTVTAVGAVAVAARRIARTRDGSK